jgi:hypothetical protein
VKKKNEFCENLKAIINEKEFFLNKKVRIELFLSKHFVFNFSRFSFCIYSYRLLKKTQVLYK